MPRPVPDNIKQAKQKAIQAKQKTILNSADRNSRKPLGHYYYENRHVKAAYEQRLQATKPAKKPKKKKTLDELLLGKKSPKRQNSTDSISSVSDSCDEDHPDDSSNQGTDIEEKMARPSRRKSAAKAKTPVETQVEMNEGTIQNANDPPPFRAFCQKKNEFC